MRRASLVAIALAACSGAPQRVGTQPSWRHPEATAEKRVQPTTFAPADSPAARYNEPVEPPPHTALGDAVIEAVAAAATQAHVPAPVADARLFRACAELAEIVPDDGVVGYGLVEFALQHNGIIEPSPQLLVVWGDVGTPASVVEQLKPQLAAYFSEGATTRIGVGAIKRGKDGSGAVVFAVQGSGVTTKPIQRALPAQGFAPLDGVLDARFRDPEVFVTHDAGDTERLPVAVEHAGAFHAQLACGAHVGRQQVEIAATDASGPTVLANFPMWCGAEPPRSISIEPPLAGDATLQHEEAEHRLLALLNRDRQVAGLAPLAWDERVAEVARAHSAEMHQTKIVAHLSPTTGSAGDRVRAANIKTAVVLENIARAYGVGEAHSGLMNSPSHRANMMSREATHVGIGVVLGDDVSGGRELFVTQVFIRVPPTIDTARAAELVRARIAATRPVGANAQLVSAAQHFAEGLAAGTPQDQLWAAARKQLEPMAGLYKWIGDSIVAVTDLDTIDGKDLLGKYKPDDIGVGVAQGPHPELGDNAIWIVVLMAERANK